MPEIIVVGAGVIGLATALSLAESNASHKITIVASHFPTDQLTSAYTSPWAGAHFRPFPSVDSKAFADSQLTRVTLKRFEKLAALEPESSVKFMEGVDLLEEKGLYDVAAKGYYEDIAQLRELTKDELPGGVEAGFSYRTWVLNAPLFIQFLQRKLEFEHGVVFQRRTVNSLKELHVDHPGAIIVNCSGRGVLYNGGLDPETFPIRGQTLLVKPPASFKQTNTVTHQAKDGKWTFYIPRPLNGGVILGGTKQIGDDLDGVRENDTAEIIERARKLYPELFQRDGTLDIRKINVGFRPARNGGVRVELERIDGATVVHAYGAGGMGYELSFGVGARVVQLLASRQSKL
jgi:glycine/D-amino acid oxidase-like deaminating enzyme